jgi:hypothetical protein
LELCRPLNAKNVRVAARRVLRQIIEGAGCERCTMDIASFVGLNFNV